MGSSVPPTPAPTAPPNPHGIPAPDGLGAIARIREIASTIRAGIKDGTIRMGAPAAAPAAPAAEPAKPAAAAAEPAAPPAPAAEKPAAELPERDTATGKFKPAEPKIGADAPPPAAADAPADESEDVEVDVVSFEIPNASGEAHVIDVPADDVETITRLRALTSEASRVPELARQLASMETEREKYGAIEHHLRHDPVSFIVNRVHDNIAKDTALALLARPGVLEAVADTIDEWREKPDTRRADFAELTADSKERTRKLSDEYQGQVQETRFVNKLVQRVERVSATVAPDKAAMFTDDAIASLETHFRRKDVEVREPTDEEFVKIIGGRLGLYSVNEADALSALKNGAPSRQPPTAKPSAEAAKKLEDAKGTGRRLVQSREARQRASAVPPSTGGAPTATPAATPPKGQTLAERVTWVQDRFGLRRSGPKVRGPGIPTAPKT